MVELDVSVAMGYEPSCFSVLHVFRHFACLWSRDSYRQRWTAMAATGPRASGGLFELESYLRCQGFEAIALVSPTCLASNRIFFTPKRNITAGRIVVHESQLPLSVWLPRWQNGCRAKCRKNYSYIREHQK